MPKNFKEGVGSNLHCSSTWSTWALSIITQALIWALEHVHPRLHLYRFSIVFPPKKLTFTSSNRLLLTYGSTGYFIHPIASWMNVYGYFFLKKYDGYNCEFLFFTKKRVIINKPYTIKKISKSLVVTKNGQLLISNLCG